LSNKYAILLLYFLDKNKKSNLVIAKIVREINLVNNLKTNILIKNNFIDFERITINIASKFVYISNCNIIISIKVKTSRVVIYISIYIRKTIIVFFQLKIIVFVYYNSILSNWNFLFKLNKLNLLLYTYLVNIEFRIILIRNNTNKTIQLSRNYCVERIIELDFLNIF